MISKQVAFEKLESNVLEMIWKEVVSAFVWKYWGKPRKFCHVYRSLVRDLNPGYPRYGIGVLNTRPRFSVFMNVVRIFSK
jgi:hypothetical protein